MHDRGQTNLDFAIGVSILLVTVVAAVTFIPALFSAVDSGNAGADEVASNRVASALVEETLADPGSPSRLDTDCTVALFNGPTEGSGCGISSSDNFEDFVPLNERRNFNVTVLRDSRHVCWDEDTGQLDTRTSGNDYCGSSSNADDTPLTAGGLATGSTDVAVTRRPVMIDGYAATLIVRVW